MKIKITAMGRVFEVEGNPGEGLFSLAADIARHQAEYLEKQTEENEEEEGNIEDMYPRHPDDYNTRISGCGRSVWE